MNHFFKQYTSALIIGGSIVVALVLVVVMKPKSVEAYGQYFGGRYVGTFDCNCSGNTLIYIQDYATNSELALIYQAGAVKLYSNNNIFGSYLLGSYSSGGSCTYHVAQTCPSMQSDGMMTSSPGVGTS